MICPNCGLDVKKGNFPTSHNGLTVLFYECPNCKINFAGYRKGTKHDLLRQTTEYPNKIPQRIQSLSPKAYRLYLDCLSAQSINLPNFSGVGLRMALEQIVFDYLKNIENIQEAQMPKNLSKMIELMNTDKETFHALSKICENVVRLFGNDTVHTYKDIPALCLNDAFFCFEQLCGYIDVKLRLIELDQAIPENKRQHSAK